MPRPSKPEPSAPAESPSQAAAEAPPRPETHPGGAKHPEPRLVPAVAFERAPNGRWVVVSLVIRGDRVLRTEAHGEPLPLGLAARVLQSTINAELIRRRLPLVAEVKREVEP
jgi:hypothetical protein